MFEIYKKAGKHHWRLALAAGGRIIAESHGGFTKQSGAKADIEKVKKLAAGAAVVAVL
jgi:uncharacterized protein YegP (UPF0339 family)